MNYLHGDQLRKYAKNDCITFRKTAEKYGGLSNMAPGFPITIGCLHFRTSEALYQCCRFPKYPDIQRQIMPQNSPMIAKEISRENTQLTRNDWNNTRIKIMQWCLYAKLICNWHKFGELLDSSGDKAIVENSYNDDFWGALWDGSCYCGVNALGRLLMRTRETYRKMYGNTIISLPPPNISNFALLGNSVSNLKINVNEQ